MPPRILSTPRWPLARRLAVVFACLLVLASVAGAAVAESAMQMRPAEDRYSLWQWEARNLPAKWLYELGELFRDERSREEQDADIARFFSLTRQINRLENSSDRDEAELARLREERDGLENRVEDTIEDRITAVLDDFGLTRKPGPLLPRSVFPPVDFEFTDSPRNLVTSPRDRIELLGTELLRADLTIDEIEEIEDSTREERDLSAIAAATSGIGAYPSIVDYLGSYEATVNVAAHEWMHNYLFFNPLGFNYYQNNDLRTMNEVVADLVGREVAEEVIRRWPVPEEPVPPTTATEPPSNPVDLRTELRALRQEVDALLVDGNVDEAEALMERRRQEFEDRGTYIRKINQAYFAFTNLYAGEDGSPGAVNPIGPKLDELRRLTPSLAEFVAIARELTSVTELDAAIAAAR